MVSSAYFASWSMWFLLSFLHFFFTSLLKSEYSYASLYFCALVLFCPSLSLIFLRFSIVSMVSSDSQVLYFLQVWPSSSLHVSVKACFPLSHLCSTEPSSRLDSTWKRFLRSMTKSLLASVSISFFMLKRCCICSLYLSFIFAILILNFATSRS